MRRNIITLGIFLITSFIIAASPAFADPNRRVERATSARDVAMETLQKVYGPRLQCTSGRVNLTQEPIFVGKMNKSGLNFKVFGVLEGHLPSREAVAVVQTRRGEYKPLVRNSWKYCPSSKFLGVSDLSVIGADHIQPPQDVYCGATIIQALNPATHDPRYKTQIVPGKNMKCIGTCKSTADNSIVAALFEPTWKLPKIVDGVPRGVSGIRTNVKLQIKNNNEVVHEETLQQSFIRNTIGDNWVLVRH